MLALLELVSKNLFYCSEVCLFWISWVLAIEAGEIEIGDFYLKHDVDLVRLGLKVHYYVSFSSR